MRKADCTPEQWDKYRAYQREYARTHKRAYPNRSAEQYLYHQRPDVKEKRQEYDRRPEVIARRKARAASDEAKKARKEVWVKTKSDPDLLRKHYDKMRKHRTGFTPEQFDALLAAQGNCCAICGKAFDDARKGHRKAKGKSYPCADHCHDGNGPRGLLCHSCNTIEGHIRGIGLTPQQYLERLHEYLLNPPIKLIETD